MLPGSNVRGHEAVNRVALGTRRIPCFELAVVRILVAAAALIRFSGVADRRRVGKAFRIGLQLGRMTLGAFHLHMCTLKLETKLRVILHIDTALSHRPRRIGSFMAA